MKSNKYMLFAKWNFGFPGIPELRDFCDDFPTIEDAERHILLYGLTVDEAEILEISIKPVSKYKKGEGWNRDVQTNTG